MPTSEVKAWIGFLEDTLPVRHLTVTGIEHTHSANSHRMFQLIGHSVRLRDDRLVQNNPKLRSMRMQTCQWDVPVDVY